MVINLNNIINYPNGKKVNKVKVINGHNNINKSQLGMDFEKMINNSNSYYLSNNIACIYKKPTPIQIVKVEYPSRNKAKITEAYFKIPSTTDYNGIYKGMYIDFEAKSCRGNNFPFSNLHVHQINHLKTVHNMGGISFLLIEYVLYNKIFLLPTTKLLELYFESLNGGRKSISYQYMKENAYEINYTYNPQIDYLKSLDIYLQDIKKKELQNKL